VPPNAYWVPAVSSSAISSASPNLSTTR